MNTYVRLTYYLAHIFLEREMFHKKVVQNMKTHILCSATFFSWKKTCRLGENVEKCGTPRQDTDDDIIRCTPSSWWVTKATDTCSENLIIVAS